jgi:hypothetical protein
MHRTETNIQTGETTEIEVFAYSNGNETIVLDEGIEPPEGFSILTEDDLLEQQFQEVTNSFIKEIESTIQLHLDTQAKSWGYDDIRSAVTYAEEPSVEQFQLEGKALRAWRSLVWAASATILEDVKSGNRQLPTKEEIFLELPSAPIRPII